MEDGQGVEKQPQAQRRLTAPFPPQTMHGGDDLPQRLTQSFAKCVLERVCDCGHLSNALRTEGFCMPPLRIVTKSSVGVVTTTSSPLMKNFTAPWPRKVPSTTISGDVLISSM